MAKGVGCCLTLQILEYIKGILISKGKQQSEMTDHLLSEKHWNYIINSEYWIQSFNIQQDKIFLSKYLLNT